jgi:hypothetical protein
MQKEEEIILPNSSEMEKCAKVYLCKNIRGNAVQVFIAILAV